MYTSSEDKANRGAPMGLLTLSSEEDLMPLLRSIWPSMEQGSETWHVYFHKSQHLK